MLARSSTSHPNIFTDIGDDRLVRFIVEKASRSEGRTGNRDLSIKSRANGRGTSTVSGSPGANDIAATKSDLTGASRHLRNISATSQSDGGGLSASSASPLTTPLALVHEGDMEDEEEHGLIGSNNYSGELLDDPVSEAVVEGQDDESALEFDHEQVEAELMLADNPFPNTQNMDEALRKDKNVDSGVDVGDDGAAVEERALQVLRQDGDDDESSIDDDRQFPCDIPMADDEVERHFLTTRLSTASLPARARSSWIEREIGTHFGTPELSPAEDANVLYHRDHSHELKPTRKHVKRILRKHGGGEDFFGTPSISEVETTQHSTTAPHVARDDGKEGMSPQKRQREPPRLDEGAWNMAFSDAQGRTRGSLKRRRRSGVDSEFKEEEVQEGGGEGRGKEENVEVDSAPLQLSPVRGAAKGAGKEEEEEIVLATPARTGRDKGKNREVPAGQGEKRVVTTEHILSLKTVKTAHGHPTNRTSTAAVAAREPAWDRSSLPRTLVQEDSEEEEREVKAETMQRHRFSQLEPQESHNAPSTREASIVSFGRQVKKRAQDDIARIQKMLDASLRAASEEKRTRGKDQEVNKKDRVLLGAAREVEGRRRPGQQLAQFQKRENSLPVPESVPPPRSSPLACRGFNAVDESLPHASTSRAGQGAPREDAPPSGAVDSCRQTGFNPAPRGHSGVVRRSRRVPRQSLPTTPLFRLEEDPYMALSYMFHPPPSGSSLACIYAPPLRPSLHHSPSNPYLSLPAHERVMVQDLGMQYMLAAMARNHGFGLEIAKRVFEEAGSMEKTDQVLREMRESANDQANISFRQMFSKWGGENGEEEDEEFEEGSNWTGTSRT